MRGSVDLFGSDRDTVSIQPGQGLGTGGIVEFSRFEFTHLGDDEILEEFRDLSQSLQLIGCLAAFVELLCIDLAECVCLGQHVCDDRAISIRRAHLPMGARISAET